MPALPQIRTEIRDAIAVLAHLYIRFDRPDAAAPLLAALAELDADPTWAKRTHSLALLQADRPTEALAEAEALLAQRLDDADRVPLLHIAAKACWKLGRDADARRFHEAARTVSAAMVLSQKRVLS